MKYTVLGSAGQIGCQLVHTLKSKGHDVVEFDTQNAIFQDLRIDYAVDSYISESDFIFFLAFDVGGSQYLKKYQSTFDFVNNNVRIMTNTFRALKELNKPFIFASTQMSNMHFSSYGTLKSIGEHYCRSLNSPIVKFWNVYGVETTPQKTHVITDFVKMALKGNPITMKTDGLEERQFLYVVDCCEALYTMSQNYDKLSRLSEYHITTFEWVTIKQIASIISELCGGATIIPSIEHDTVQRDQRNEPNQFVLTEGLWKPQTTIHEGISKIVKYEKSLLNETN
jgi:nucleoside-diphosphate-sugar epimerase